MINIRKSEDRGIFDHGWLYTAHTFSFARYYNPEFMGFRNLLVINEDTIQPDNGFGKHYHDNMEIITYVTDGELEHTDSMGNNYKIKAGEVQVMTAGTGIMHSEVNPSHDTSVHLFQIWVIPEERQLTPAYNQKDFSKVKENQILIASNDARENSLKINQDVNLYIIRLKKEEFKEINLDKDRYFWIQVAKGSVEINGQNVVEGDGAYGGEEDKLNIKANEDSEVLFFDLN